MRASGRAFLPGTHKVCIIPGPNFSSWERNVSEMSTRPSIPLPAAAATLRVPGENGDGAAELVAAFVRATAALTAEAAAQLAAVRPETIRKWRRRLPNWLKAGTRRRLAAHLAGEPPAPATDEDGFRRAFHRTLRAAPPQ